MAKKPLKVKVIGTGGIGLCVLPTLSRFLNYSSDQFPSVEVSLIDGDVFEEKNKARQSFGELGSKSSVTAAEYSKEFERLQFKDHPTYIDDHNVNQLIKEKDIVLLCVDNHKTRKLVSDRAAELNDVTIISGGNDWTDGNVLIHIRRDGKDLTPAMTSKFHPEIANPTDKHPSEVVVKKGCQAAAPAAPQLLITNNLIAANMLAAFYNIVDSFQVKAVMEKPAKFAEVYCDVATLCSVTRERKVTN